MSDRCVKILPINVIDKLLYKTFTTFRKPGWLEVGETKTVLPLKYLEIADKVENFQVRDEDIFVTSHPRTGTTWTQEMVWLIANNCDFEGAKKLITQRYPFLEGACHLDNDTMKTLIEADPAMDYINYANNIKGRRFLKTHLPWNLLPKCVRDGAVRPKIIYVTRNPKDSCVSFYHVCRSLHEFFGTLDDFCELFLAGREYYGPFWNNVFSYWNRKDDPNILFIKYEEMKTNMPSVLNQVSAFLEMELSEIQIITLTEHLSFGILSQNKSVNCELGLENLRSLLTSDTNFSKFMRKGEIGSHKEEMSSAMIRKFDAWIDENTKDTGITFY